MAIMQSIKRAFGFATMDDDLDNDDLGCGPAAAESGHDDRHEGTAPDGNEQEATRSEEIPVEVIDSVLALINDALPPIVKECIDGEAQRRYLYAAMGDAIKSYLARIGGEARKEAFDSCGAERAKLQADIASLRAKEQKAEKERAEQQSSRLSAERQKRALTERVHDLESKVSALEAEREQLLLETKSLMNKLKVAEVKNSDTDSLQERIESLNKQLLAQSKANTRLTLDLNERDAEIARLKDELDTAPADVQTGLSDDDRRELEQIKAQIENFEEIKSRQDKRIAELEAELTAARASATAKESGDEPRKKRRRKQTAKISAIDESIDSVDWLVAAGPGESPARSVTETASDFGYQPPVRREIADDDAQLTLF